MKKKTVESGKLSTQDQLLLAISDIEIFTEHLKSVVQKKEEAQVNVFLGDIKEHVSFIEGVLEDKLNKGQALFDDTCHEPGCDKE
jgi:homoserine kinase